MHVSWEEETGEQEEERETAQEEVLRPVVIDEAEENTIYWRKKLGEGNKVKPRLWDSCRASFSQTMFEADSTSLRFEAVGEAAAVEHVHRNMHKRVFSKDRQSCYDQVLHKEGSVQ